MSDTLRNAREAARKVGIKVPKNMKARRMGKLWFFIESPDMEHPYQVKADNAYDAKAKYIFDLIYDRQTPSYW